MVIPDQFSLGGAFIGLALAAVPGGYSFTRALIGALLGYVLLWGVKLAAEKALKKPALGVGDIHMMAMVGAFTGVSGALITLFLGSVFGLVIGVPFSMIRGKQQVLGSYLPLGVFLAMAGVVAYFWGDLLAGWYIGLIS
jgi:leader peptidase (prepilin peptidase)/N-methyltransferase